MKLHYQFDCKLEFILYKQNKTYPVCAYRNMFDSFHSEEIEYIMMCVDANQDGKVDFHEFTDRFHNPAKDIGFTTALLLTNLSEHMPNDPRYV